MLVFNSNFSELQPKCVQDATKNVLRCVKFIDSKSILNVHCPPAVSNVFGNLCSTSYVFRVATVLELIFQNQRAKFHFEGTWVNVERLMSNDHINYSINDKCSNTLFLLGLTINFFKVMRVHNVKFVAFINELFKIQGARAHVRMLAVQVRCSKLDVRSCAFKVC